MGDEKFVNIAKLMTSYNFEIEELPDNLKCKMCKMVLKNACQVPCACKFCRICIDDMRAKGTEFCPGVSDQCRESRLSNFELDYTTNQIICRLIVKCPHHGCVHECQLLNMEEHLRQCPKRSVQCPFHEIGCTQYKLAAEEVDWHLQREIYTHSDILIGKFANLKKKVRVLKETGEVSSREIEILKERLEKSNREVDILKEIGECNSREVEILKKRNESSNREIDILKERDEYNRREIEIVKESNKIRNRELEMFKKKNEDSRRDIDLLKLADEVSRKDIEMIKNRNKDSKKEIKELQKRDKDNSLEIEVLKLNDKDKQKEIDILKDVIKISREEAEMMKQKHDDKTKEIKILNQEHKDNQREIETLNIKSENTMREIDGLKHELIGKDGEIKTIMNQLMSVEKEKKSIKEDKEDLVQLIELLSEKLARGFDEIRDNEKLFCLNMVDHVDREIGAISEIIGNKNEEDKDDILSKYRGPQSITNDLRSMRYELQLIQEIVGLVDAKFNWVIDHNIAKTTWNKGSLASIDFYGQRHPYKYQLMSWNKSGELWIYLCINTGPNDERLAWPFQGRVVITVADKQRCEVCRCISRQCKINMPRDKDGRISDYFKFRHSELTDLKFDLSHGVSVSSSIVPGARQ